MQPTYLPWSGYFGLINIVDEFVFLDNVQFARRSWQQRNKIKARAGERLLTVPVNSKGQRDQIIKDVKISRDSNFFSSHQQAILHAYSKAPYYKPYADILFEAMSLDTESLCNLNINIIKAITKILRIETKFTNASDLNSCGKKEELLANICKEIDATDYISVPGSAIYLDSSSIFKEQGIPIEYFCYEHPVYNQLYGEFTPYISIIDMLFCVGEDSKLLIKKSSSLTQKITIEAS